MSANFTDPFFDGVLVKCFFGGSFDVGLNLSVSVLESIVYLFVFVAVEGESVFEHLLHLFEKSLRLVVG